ncbi:hypothetical protein HaLaN_01198 [Haematococcus lacustris]|uniref:RAP domain-containing protein n=1 Tax=Haematococcus lacustris TaxID=44745 RepID=A0A699YKL0_HAELA|nr:hypothetical protein HaLaN_01198 [Haematococcus lacustris]
MALRQYDPPPRPKQDLEELVSAVQFDARQLSKAAWSLGKLKPHLPAAAVTSACTALASHSASSEVMKRGGWREWSTLLHGLATTGMQCSSSPDLTWLCDQAVQLLPVTLARGAASQDISMTLWAMANSVRSLAAGVAKADLAAFTTQAIANLLYARSMFLALSIHQAVSSGHSQLASEPQLNSMAAALMSGVVAHAKLQQLTHFDAGVMVNKPVFDQLASDSERAAFMREQVRASLPEAEVWRQLLQAGGAGVLLGIPGQSAAIVDGGGGSSTTGSVGQQPGGSSTTGLAGQQPGGSSTKGLLLVQGPGLTRGISVEESPNFLPDGSMSGVVAHVKLQQVTHFDTGVVVNKAVFDQLASDSERAAFMREQAKSAGALPSQRAGQAPGLMPRPVRPKV